MLRRCLVLTALVGLLGCDDGDGTGDTPPPDSGPLDAADPMTDGAAPDDAGPDGDLPPDAGPAEGCALRELAAGDGLVATGRGWVQGIEEDGVWRWQGVPFAAPPVGDLRFAPPAPHACWDDVMLTTAFGPKCAQYEVTLGGARAIGDEDCLTLNVWSPVGVADGRARPVLFFIHGGGNIVGSASEALIGGAPIYNGAALAARGDAVVVTTQYRLGPLGFLSLPELDAEGATGTSGNQGLQDQIAALEWVQRNISAFGGDPTRVMVFGESAGGINTCMMATSPLTAGLMHRALIQSGGCGAVSRARAQEVSAAAAALFDCEGDDRLACLRGVDAATLMLEGSGTVGLGDSAADNGLSWGPSVDGHVLVADPLTRAAAGQHAHVPLVVGSNADEMAATSINRVSVETAEEYAAAVRATFAILGGMAVEYILEAYPVDDFESPNDAFIQVTTDAFFTCTARNIARTFAAGQDAPVYRYLFARRFETAMGPGRAAHGIELLYVFRSYEDIPGYVPAAGEHAVADQMMDAWLAFAATGDPGGGAAGDWPPYVEPGESAVVFDDPPDVEDGIRGAQCDLWETIIPDDLR